MNQLALIASDRVATITVDHASFTPANMALMSADDVHNDDITGSPCGAMPVSQRRNRFFDQRIAGHTIGPVAEHRRTSPSRPARQWHLAADAPLARAVSLPGRKATTRA